MKFGIPDFRRKEQVPNWLLLRWHPAPVGQVHKVRDEDGTEYHAILTYSREWRKCTPTGRIIDGENPKPSHWLHGFVVA